MAKRLSVHSLFLLSLITFSPHLIAGPVTFNFEGIIDFIDPASDFGATGSAVSDSFSGSYTFESTTAGTPGAWPWITEYLFPASQFSMSLDIGSTIFNSDPATGGVITTYNFVGTFEEYRVNGYLPDGSLIDLVMGTSGNLYPTLPIDTLPDYTAWNEILITDTLGQSFAGMLTSMSIEQITTTTPAPTPGITPSPTPSTPTVSVPEPSSFLLMGLALALVLRKSRMVS